MKITLTSTTPALVTTSYPCLKKADYFCVVLFIAPNTGVVVQGSENYQVEIGWFSDTWTETNFTPYSGTVTFKS